MIGSHHIREILGDDNAVVTFEAVADEAAATFPAIEVQVLARLLTSQQVEVQVLCCSPLLLAESSKEVNSLSS